MNLMYSDSRVIVRGLKHYPIAPLQAKLFAHAKPIQ